MREYFLPSVCICTTIEDIREVRCLPDFIDAMKLPKLPHPRIIGALGDDWVYYVPLNLNGFTEAERKFIYADEGIPV